jgi:hypothetical protein
MPFEKDPNEIGALWLKTSAKGDYLTGEIDGVSVVCFAVKSGSAKAPAWRVLKSRPRDAQAESTCRLDTRAHDRRSSQVDEIPTPSDDDLGSW